MTADDFRELALQLPDVVEKEHMRHPDFRAHGHIFATLAYPTEEWGMVKLDPADQKRFVDKHGHAFTPVKGAWGLQGCTSVKLASAQRDVVAQALDLAWQKSASEAAAKANPNKTRPAVKKTPAKKSAGKAAGARPAKKAT
jgi:hypothetical protein